MDEPFDRDQMATLRATFDQLNTTLREGFIKPIVDIEKIVLRAGGSPGLAESIAYEYAARMFDMAGIRRTE